MKKSQLLNFFRVTLLLLIFSAFTTSAWGAERNLKGGDVLYLKPNANWTSAGARFAMYLCNGSSKAEWVNMKNVETGIYSATVPSGDYKNVIFCRMNPDTNDNNFNDGVRWNQTGDLRYNEPNNLCAINNGEWNCGSNVTWSQYAGGGSSTTSTYYLMGDFNNWESGNPFTNGTCTMNISAGTYKFKVNAGSTWYGNDGIISYDILGWTFETNKGDCTLNATISGNYVFTWNADTKKLDVKFPTNSGNTTAYSFWGFDIQYKEGNETTWVSSTLDKDFISTSGDDEVLDMGVIKKGAKFNGLRFYTNENGNDVMGGNVIWKNVEDSPKAIEESNYGIWEAIKSDDGNYGGKDETYEATGINKNFIGYANGTYSFYLQFEIKVDHVEKKIVRTIKVTYTINEFEVKAELNGPCYVGDQVKLIVEGGKSPYTWQTSSDGVSWNTLSGVTGITYTHKVADKIYFRVKDSDSKITEVVELTPSIKCDPNHTNVIFKETFGEFSSEKARRSYNVTTSAYSAYVPVGENEYSYQETECAAMKSEGYYAVVANPKYAGCGETEVNHGDADCDCTNKRRWYRDTKDHTVDTSDAVYGGMLFYNCKDGTETDDVIYECIINDICINTYINFSAWVTNANTGDYGNIPIEAEFRLFDASVNNSAPISTYKVTDIELANKWKEIAAMFNSGTAQSVKIQLVNKAAAGQGNDLLLDDITLSICAPEADLVFEDTGTEQLTVLAGSNVTLDASILSGIMTNNYYVWQKSTELDSNGNVINWNKIEGPTEDKNKYTDTNVSTTTYYRAVVGNTTSDANAGAGGTSTSVCGMYAVTNIATVKVTALPISFTTHPSDQTVCEGGSAIFSVAATGADAYQWQKRTDNTDWTDIPDATKTTYEITKTTIGDNNTYYRVKATNDSGTTEYSGTAKLTVYAKPGEAKAGDDQTQCNNGTFKMTATPADTEKGIVGTWSYATPSDAQKVSISDVNAHDAEVSGVPAGSSVTLKWTLSNQNKDCDSVFDEVILTNNAKPVLTVEYKDKQGNITTEATINCASDQLTANLSGATTYKWDDTSTDNPRVFTRKDATTTYEVIGTSDKGCESDPLKITVTEDFVSPTLEIKDLASVCLPATVDITNAIGSETKADKLKYYSDEELNQELPTTVVEAAKDAKYYVVGYNNNGCKAEPVEIPVNVKPVSKAPTVENYYQCPGAGDKELKEIEGLVTSDNSNLIFYKGETGEETETKVSLVNTGTTDKIYTYWVSNTELEKCESPRSEVSVTIYRTPKATLSGNSTICNGDPASLTLSLEGTPDYTIEYQPGVSGTPNTITVSPTSTKTYNIGDLISTVTDGNTCSATLSGSATVTVKEIKITEDIEKEEFVCADQSIEYEVIATGDGLKYQWYESDNGSSFSPILNATSSSYKTNSFNLTDTKQYYVEISQYPKYCESIESSISKVEVRDCSSLELSYNLNESVCKDSEITLNLELTNNSDVDLEDIEVTIVGVSNQDLKENVTDYDHTTGKWSVGSLDNKEGTNKSKSISIKIKGTTTGKDILTYAYISKVGTTTYDKDDSKANKVTKKYTVKEISGKPVIVDKPYAACSAEGGIDFNSEIKAKTDINTGIGTLTFYTEDGITPLTFVSKKNSGLNSITTIYYVTNEEAGKCVSDPVQGKVTVYGTPTATLSLSGDRAICPGGTTELKVEFEGESKDGALQYDVKLSDNNTTDTFSKSTDNKINVTPALTGVTDFPKDFTYELSEVKNIYGCSATLSGTATVTVNSRPELLSFKFEDKDAIICAGTTTELVAEFSGEAPFAFEINGQQYKTTEKGTYTEKDGKKTWTLELDNNVVNTAGTYQFTLTNLSDANCSSETLDNNKVTLEVEALPVIKDVPTEVNLNCSQTTATIKASNASTYKWFYKDVDGVEQFFKAGSELSLSQTDVNVAERTTVYTVYGYSEKANCKSKEAKTVTVTEDFVVPTLEIVALTSVCLPATVDIKEAIGSETKADELKYYSDKALTQELTNTNVQAAKDAKYYVVGYNDNGCKSQEEISINVTDVSGNVEVNNLYNGFCPTQKSSTVNLSELVTSNKEGLKYYNKNSDGTYSEITTGEPSFDTSKEFASHTYYITNTKTGKCESTTPTPVTIQIYKPVTATISGISPLCSGETSNVTITLDGTPEFEVLYNNGTTDVPKNISGFTLNITESLTSTTSYKLVSVTDKNNCQAYLDGTEFVTVEVNSRPELVSFEIEDTNDIICEDESTTLKATFTGTAPFSFKINGEEKTSHATEWSMTISDPKEYVITDLSDLNCSAETISNNSATLTVEEIPVVTLSTTSAELDCNTEDITLTASGANTYSWTDNKGSAAQAVASIVAQQTGSETIYTVVGTSEHGCVSKDVSVTVTENFVTPTVELKTKLQPNGSPMSTELNCRLKTIPVVADTENSPVEIVKYEWSNGGSANEYNDLTAKGTYTVTVTGKNGCTADAEIVITENIVKPILSVEHIGSRTEETTTILNCNDQSVNITSSVSNVSAIGGSVEYFWYKDGDKLPENGETLGVSEDGTYKIVAVGKNNCESDFTVKLTKDDTKPKAEIVASAEMVTCSTPEVNLTVKTDVDCNYFWTGIVGEDAKKQTLKVEEGGTYTVFVQSNVNGCKTTLNHTLEQHTDLPTITIASSQGKVTCNPNTLTASGANEYVWNTGEKTESIVVTTGGTYTVTGTNEYGCEKTKEIVLEENKLVPTISLTADTTHVTCRNEDVTLTVDITNAEATRSYTYKWLQGTETSDVTVATFDAKEKATYKVIVTDQTNACFAEETIDVQENKQTPSIETKSLDAVCLPATVDIKDAITSTNAEEVKYFADKELTQELPTTEVEAAQDAKYYVVGYEFENNGCVTEPIEIAINVKPVSATPVVENYEECAADGTKTLSSLVKSDKTNLLFFADETSTEPIEDKFVASEENTATSYWVSNTEPNSCVSERVEFQVNIYGYIDFSVAASDTRLPAGRDVTITVTPLTDTPVDEYVWYRGEEVIQATDELELTEQLYLNEKYSVQAIGRCNSPKKEVEVEAVWPTAFTPHNGNGKNDSFADGMNIIVFNRFYTKIYEGPDGWDGSINGAMNDGKETAVPGVYYYSVQLPNGQVKKGTIEIVKID